MAMRRYLQAACVLSALAMPALARADDAAAAEAQARFREGLALADNAKFEEARLKFLQAVAVLKAPAVLYNLAATEQKTGRKVDAIEHYRGFLKTGATDTRITDAMRDKARQNIAELLKSVGQIEIEAPEGAKLSVDGKPLDEAPREPLAVAPGTHKVEATFGGRIKSVTVESAIGKVVKARIEFEAPTSEPKVEPTPAPEPEGERSTAGWAVPIGLGVLGTVAVVTGAVFAKSSTDNEGFAIAARRTGVCGPGNEQLPDCKTYSQSYDAAESDATNAWIAYATGGVLLAASVAAFVFWPKSAKSAAASQGVRIMPIVGAQNGLKLTF